MTVLNFAHPLTAAQLAAIETLTGQAPVRIIEIPTRFDPDRPFADQTRELVASAGLTPREWQSLPLLVNLPSLGVIAASLLAELHGRCGYFPAALRLRPVEGITPPQFEVAETINLQTVRDAARNAR